MVASPGTEAPGSDARRYAPEMTTPPVLLVHGFASSYLRNWVEPGWVDLLSEAGREVIGVDLLGHGDAPKPHDPAAYEHLEDSVVAAVGDRWPVDAIGFSLGAQLLLRLAAAAPERFSHLVVGGVGRNVFEASDPEPAARAVLTGEAADGDHEAAQAFSRFARAPGNDPEALAACLRRPHERLRPEDLSGVHLPVLVVLGDRDFAGPAAPLLDALPQGRLVTLAGGDHFGAPKDFRFLDAALEFLGAQPG